MGSHWRVSGSDNQDPTDINKWMVAGMRRKKQANTFTLASGRLRFRRWQKRYILEVELTGPGSRLDGPVEK